MIDSVDLLIKVDLHFRFSSNFVDLFAIAHCDINIILYICIFICALAVSKLETIEVRIKNSVL